MTKNPSRKRSKVYVLIIPQVIRTLHFSKWTLRGMRIFVLIVPQEIRIYFGGWEAVALLMLLNVEL